MAFSAVTERGSGVEKLLDSSFTGSPSAALTVGKIVFVLVATDNRSTVAGATTNHSTLTDTDGHTWAKVYERTSTAGAANDGVTHSLWWAKVASEIGTGDVFTFTLDGDTTSKVMGFWEVTVGAGNTIQLAASTFLEELATTDPTSIALSGLPSKEYLFLGIIAREEENVNWVEAANFTNVFAAEGVTSSTAGVPTSNVLINVGRRIVTGTGETFNVGTIAGASQEIAQALLAFEEISTAPTGTIAVTQADQAAAFTGLVANPITGTIAVTQSDQTAAFVGSLGISGTIASTQQDQTAAFVGTTAGADWDCGDWDPLDWSTDCAPTGIIASIQANQTSVFTGTVANPITGTIGVTQQNQTAAFTGTTVSDGTLNSIQQDQIAAFTGTVTNPISGTIGVTQANQTAAFSGTVTVPAVTGTIAVTQQDQIGAFIGQGVSPSVTGTIAVTQANQTMAATGVVAMAVVGTIGVTQQNQTASFAGSVANPSDTLVVSVSCTIGGPAASCTISPEMAVVGSDVYITSNYTNAAGQPANPAVVSAVVEAPDGTQTTPIPTSITLGEWTTIIPTDQSGFWFFEITGQGDTVNVVCKGSFCVERSLVSV